MTGLPLHPSADGPLVFLIRAARARLRADDEILLQIDSRDPREQTRGGSTSRARIGSTLTVVKSRHS